NLVGTEFSADPSLATDTELSDAITASEALDLDKVIGNESVTGLTFDGGTSILTLTQDGAANETVNLGALDTDTQYTAGTGLNLVGTEFSADPSLATDTELSDAITASEALDLDKVIGNESVTGLTFDGGTSILTLTQDGAANETVNLGALDTDTQYTAGTGLNLVGTEFSADPSLATDTELSDAITASEALDLDKVIGNESVTGLTFDGGTSILTLTQDGAANETVNLGALDTDTQYTAGTGLNLVGTEFSADPSLATDTELSDAITASEALDLDKVIGNESVTGLTFDGGTSILTLTQDGAANETVNLGALDTDTQYTAGTGLNLVGTEFSADPSLATDTELSDAITASEALDLDKVIGNETITGLAFDGAVLTISEGGNTDQTINISSLDTDTQYTAGTGLNLVGTEFSADPSLATDTELSDAITASEALDLDKVIGNESVTGLTFDGGTSILTVTQDGAANETVNLGALDTDTQYTAGTGLNLVGTEFSADPSLATDTELSDAITASEALDL
ncbi:hypothetical protein, partial [Maribacter caenipelagi]|uniref:hypothetical protein n=1 Tax=Maribacter caenipelagi TaxID=1447781 RepID=UPI001AAE4774